MNLATRYLGFSLPHPFIAGASPVADDVDRLKRFEDAGIAAVVLRSLFEEQLDQEALAHHGASTHHAESHGEALSYLPESDDCVFGPDEYLAHLARVKDAVSVPVIASLNGYTPTGWVDHARHVEAAGADALELNLYYVATDANESAADLERQAVEIVRSVAAKLTIPLAVKLSPFYTSLANFAQQLRDAGADGLVLFNRFFEPDIDIEDLEVRTQLELSHRHELLLRLRWLAILSGQLADCSLACSGGVHTTQDAIKAVMSGAHAIQLVAALLKGGPEKVTTLRQELAQWLEEHEYDSLAQMRGSMDLSRTPDPKAFERGNYMRVLRTWRISD